MKREGVRRPQVVVSWIVQLLLAAMFALQGGVKIEGSPAWVARFRHWGYPERFVLVVGLIELLGAAMLLIPMSAPYGALLLMVVMLGAAATHLAHWEPQVITAVVLFALLFFVLYVHRTRLPWRRADVKGRPG